MCGKLHIEVYRVPDFKNATKKAFNNLSTTDNNYEDCNVEANQAGESEGFLGRTITCRVITHFLYY